EPMPLRPPIAPGNAPAADRAAQALQQALQQARVLAGQGRAGEAEQLLQQVTALGDRHPLYGPAIYQLGILAARREDFARARDCFTAALKLAPQAPEILISLATALHETGEAASARPLAEKALGLTAAPATLSRLGAFLQQAGDKELAERAFDKALGIDPSHVPAHYGLAYLRKARAGDAHLDRLRALADAETLSPNDRMLAAFALGKTEMDLGNSTAGFTRFAEASRRKKALLSPFSADAFDRYIDGIIALFDNAAAARLKTIAANDSDRPVFIVGMPRSGSTLIDQVLSSHPDVTSLGEAKFLNRCLPVYPNHEFPQFAAQPSWTPELLAALPARAKEIGDKYIAATAASAGGARRVVDKMLFNYLWAGVIRAALPNAKIIHCIRDPRDIALSIWQLHFPNGMGWAYDLGDIGRYYLSCRRLMEHWHRIFPGDIYTAKYEDMVADPEAQTRRLLDWCGLPFDARCLSFHETDRIVKTASASQVRQPIYRDSAGKWKKHAAHLAPLLSVLEGAGITGDDY
ncbi:MAG TPA: sulfotransferase, partial [Patescibacteria group bacterium]|nr:sulfotransferase [Patescibacteria group bacterium]